MTCRRGPARYAHVLALLLAEPRTDEALGPLIGTSRLMTRHILRGMATQGLVHRAGKHKIAHQHGPAATVWGPFGQATPGRCRVGMVAFANVVRALQRGTHTQRELVAESGLCRNTVHRLLKQLRADHLVHIGTWDRSDKLPLPAFVWGPGRDAERPKPAAPAAVARRFGRSRAARLRQLKMLHAIAANASYFQQALGA